MSNPLYNALGNAQNNNNIINQFLEFKKQMNGKNPQEEINNLLRSGKISQEQLNQVQQMAMQMRGLFK